MEEGGKGDSDGETSVSDRVFASMCSSVLSTYQSILKDTEIEILRRIVNLDSDSRRVLYAMYKRVMEVNCRYTRKTKYFFCSKCRVQVPHLSDVVMLK